MSTAGTVARETEAEDARSAEWDTERDGLCDDEEDSAIPTSPGAGADLRGPVRSLPVSPPADGAADGYGADDSTWDPQDDGRLGFRVENAIKVDFIQNALNLARNLPVSFPRIAEYG